MGTSRMRDGGVRTKCTTLGICPTEPLIDRVRTNWLIALEEAHGGASK